jgi:tetratricopeptide (TPR) repeat protein
MSVRAFQFAAIALALVFGPTSANAQYNANQCALLRYRIADSMSGKVFKQMIVLEREYLTYCKDQATPVEYASHLEGLAIALNEDGQYQEAVAVANRCLQVNPADLGCYFAKADGLQKRGQLQEAKAIIEKALTIGAITEVDASAKKALRALLPQINEAINVHAQQASRNQNSMGDRRPPREGSAKVTGNIPCSGTAIGISMDIDGEIDNNTVESVRKLFAQYHDQQNRVRSGSTRCEEQRGNVDFSAYGSHYGTNSPGGSVAAAMAIGRMFRREGAWLGVDGVCVSACVLILAGAVDRQLVNAGTVGIHRPYLATSPQRPLAADQMKNAYGAMLQDIRSYLHEMNVSERLADDMLAIAPERVHMLSSAELDAYGLAGVDAAEQQRRAIENEVRDVEEANKLGLDRREYTRRKALGESLCLFTVAGEPMTDYSQFWTCKQRVLQTGKRSPAPKAEAPASQEQKDPCAGLYNCGR